jgi:uncharacterized protein (TIGR00730 family)
MTLRAVAVFCASNVGRDGIHHDAARDLGTAVATRGLSLVYGGASVGMMGIVADAALDAGGCVVGVITAPLIEREIAHPRLTELLVVDSMAERKAAMADRADAFVMLPGGYGTLDEFFEMVTWARLHIHEKPCAIYNVEGFFDPLVDFLARCVDAELLRPEHFDMLVIERDLERLLDRLSSWQPAVVEKWFDRPG